MAYTYRKAGEMYNTFKKRYKSVTVRKYREGKKILVFFYAKARQNTPYNEKAIMIGGSPKVHIATYIPSTNKVYYFRRSMSYAVKKR